MRDEGQMFQSHRLQPHYQAQNNSRRRHDRPKRYCIGIDSGNSLTALYHERWPVTGGKPGKIAAIRLAEDFVRRECVARGMVADIAIHWVQGSDGQPQPHAHILLTLRGVEGGVFGPKRREWNATALLQHWRGR